jgi:hypothetical protein
MIYIWIFTMSAHKTYELLLCRYQIKLIRTFLGYNSPSASKQGGAASSPAQDLVLEDMGQIISSPNRHQHGLARQQHDHERQLCRIPN